MKKSELKLLIKEVISEMRILKESYITTIKDPTTGEMMDVEVEYDYHRGHMGRRIGMARFAEPDEQSQVEIQRIVTTDGREIDPDSLDQNTRENLEQSILDQEQGM